MYEEKQNEEIKLNRHFLKDGLKLNEIIKEMIEQSYKTSKRNSNK